ncbi:tail fiber protein [Sporosarcina sp. E16_8]|uniref:tail fiber protein n=1 Tax=Sporosarcina sp. E16_8 TaxID=2789295 RepID=UPI00210377CC|nr:tail fiber protein [Sporosarcina sp. E16_8]
MAEHSKFFDSIDPLAPDKVYTADEFTGYFEKLVTTGIMKGESNMLKVETIGSNMNTTVDTGAAYINGRLYENDSKLSLTHEVEALGKSRIDRVVVRLILDVDSRYIKAFVKKGVAGVSPVVPALVQTKGIYEVSLAQVKVIGGQTYINAVDVTDERGKDVICPWAGSKILPNFDDVALAGLVSKVDTMSTLADGIHAGGEYSVILPNVTEYATGMAITIKTNSPNTGPASINVNNLGKKRIHDSYGEAVNANFVLKGFALYELRYNGEYFVAIGLVSLNDTLTSTSTTAAATANAVKMVNDKVDSTPLAITPIAPFLEGYTGAFRVSKNARHVGVNIELTNDTALLAQAYQLGNLPAGYRPLVLTVGYVTGIVSGKFLYIPVTISPMGSIILQNTASIPSVNQLAGSIFFVLP